MIVFIIIFIVLFGTSLFVFIDDAPSSTFEWARRFVIVSVISALLTWIFLTIDINDNKFREQNEKNLQAWNANLRKRGCYISSYAGKDANIPMWTCPDQKDVIRGYN